MKNFFFSDAYAKRNKRKASEDATSITPNPFFSCNFTVGDLLKELDMGRYGNVTDIMNSLLEDRMSSLKPFYKLLPESACSRSIEDSRDTSTESGEKSVKLKNGANCGKVSQHIVIIDSDEEEVEDQAPVQPCQDVLFSKTFPSSAPKVLFPALS